MTAQITEELKKAIFEMIVIPSIQIEDIAEKLNIDYDTVMDVLSDEYYKYDLSYGRRMCCRF